MKMKIAYSFAIALLTCITANAQTWRLNGNTMTGAEILGSKNAFPIRFVTNNQQRMTINTDGRVGIGTTTPTAFLHVFGTTQIENNSATIYDEPLLTLVTNTTGTPTNPVIAFRTPDTLYAVTGYDFSTRDFVISTLYPGISPDFIINHNTGFVGLGTKTPTKTLDVYGSGNISGDLTVTGTNGLGDLFFTYYQQGIRFPTFGATNENSAMIYMTDQPTANARMVLAHSKTYSNWGLEYNDANDQFNFLGSGINRMAINLSSGRVGIGNAAPSYTFDVTGTSRFLGNIGVQTIPNLRTIQCGATQGSLIGIGTAEYIQDAGSSTLSAAASWLPVTDNVYSIGSSTFRWQDVWAVDGTINTSDLRDKTNIRDLNYGLKEIMQLRSVRYNWKNKKIDGDKLGVIAQEIQKVMPEVVRDYEYKTDETTGVQTKVKSERLGVMYADIIPVLIKGMQEQQQMIEELQNELQQMKNAQSQTSSVSNNAAAITTAALEQNMPNPVKTATVIKYNTGNSKNAVLIITDNSGNTVKQITLAPGAGNTTIDCSALASGVYTYSIIADGKTIASKKMAVAK